MKNSTISLVIFNLLLSIIYSYGQSSQPVINFPSPNATALGVYGETPVSLFTGTANINIPIHTVKSGDLEVPIFLTYDASGVRPNVHPGWTGMGWSLNAGGLITRKVRGLADEYSWNQVVYEYDGDPGSYFDPSNPGYYNYGFMHNQAKLSGSSWQSPSHINNLAKGDFAESSVNGIGTWVDTEPDEFVFNFNGYQGKFYFTHDNKIKSCFQSRNKS